MASLVMGCGAGRHSSVATPGGVESVGEQTASTAGLPARSEVERRSALAGVVDEGDERDDELTVGDDSLYGHESVDLEPTTPGMVAAQREVRALLAGERAFADHVAPLRRRAAHDPAKPRWTAKRRKALGPEPDHDLSGVEASARRCITDVVNVAIEEGRRQEAASEPQ